MSEAISRDIAKYWWLQCVACSEASMTTQLRGFGIVEPVYEQALHAFSGGFMRLGHACGLLTGTALAAGFAAQARFDGNEMRSAAALHTTIKLAKAFPQLAGSVNCRAITEIDFTNLSGRLRYIREGKARICGRLHLNWSAQAHRLINKELSAFEEHRTEQACANCAVMTLKKAAGPVGMVAEDSVLVAGLAGGVGLLGNLCGALAAGVYALSVSRYLKQHGKKRDSRIRGSLQELSGSSFAGNAAQLRMAFIDRFDGDLCIQIAARQFQDIEEHSAFIKRGGCREVIAFVADWIERRFES